MPRMNGTLEKSSVTVAHKVNDMVPFPGASGFLGTRVSQTLQHDHVFNESVALDMLTSELFSTLAGLAESLLIVMNFLQTIRPESGPIHPLANPAPSLGTSATLPWWEKKAASSSAEPPFALT
jgi:hypothetical protein